MRFVCEVLRPIPGTEHAIGDVVDVTEWANRELLIAQRYLRERDVAAGSSDGDAALRAQVTELEATVAAQGARLTALEKALGVEPAAEAKPPGRRAKGAAADKAPTAEA